MGAKVIGSYKSKSYRTFKSWYHINYRRLNQTFSEYKPDIVFQPLVRLSYENPIETNVIGTLKVFEACRNSKYHKW